MIEYNLTVLDNSYGTPGNFGIGICRRKSASFGKGWSATVMELARTKQAKAKTGR